MAKKAIEIVKEALRLWIGGLREGAKFHKKNTYAIEVGGQGFNKTGMKKLSIEKGGVILPGARAVATPIREPFGGELATAF